MNQMQAGLPNQRPSGAVNYRIGDLKPFTNGTRITFTDEDGIWLKTGNLLDWGGAYKDLVKNHKGVCVKDYPAISSAVFLSMKGLNVYKVNGQYHGVAGDNSQRLARVGSGGDLSFSVDLSGGLGTNGMTQMNCSMLMAGGVVCVGGQWGGANNAILSSTNNAAYSTASAAANSYGCMASNSAGTLGVASQTSVNSTGTSNLYTTVNGTSYTTRNGSGGTNAFINAIYWCPCGNNFLFALVGGAMNKSTDGFTQTSCTIPSSVTNFHYDNWKNKAASSATSTIIVASGSGNKIIRTTDGNVFTEIFPFANEPYSVANNNINMTIGYDGTRFVIFANRSNDMAPTYWYSEDDGLTWFASWAYETVTDPQVYTSLIYSMQFATDKFIFGCASQSSNIDRVYDMTGQIGSSVQPTKVGVKWPNGTPTNFIKVA